MFEKSGWENVSLDESNNGQDNKPPYAIYFSVFSNSLGDTKKIDERGNYLSKRRKNHNKLKFKLKERNYSFLLLDKSEYGGISPYKRIGIILASLVCGESIGEYLNCYIDGIWNKNVVDFSREILKDVTGLERDLITIFTGKDLDRRIPLVNMADESAYYFIHKPHKNLTEDPHRKELLLK